MKTVLTLFAILSLTPVVSAGVDRANTAESLVSAAAIDIAESEGDQLADVILSNIDVAAIARFTLGRHGRSLNEADHARFKQAFEAYLRRQIIANADQFTGVEMTVTKTTKRNAHDAVVTTQLDRAGDQVILRWRVLERGGHWSIVDLEFAGIWLAIEQRAQVNALLGRPGATLDSVIVKFQ